MAAIDRVFKSLDDLSRDLSAIGKSVAVLMDDRDDAKTKRRLTYEKMEELARRTSAVEGGLKENTRVCTDMRDDVDAMQRDIADYRHNRERVAPALQKIEVIEQHITNCQLRAAHEEGWWDAMKRLGAIGWTILGVIATGLAMVLHYSLPKISAALGF